MKAECKHSAFILHRYTAASGNCTGSLASV